LKHLPALLLGVVLGQLAVALAAAYLSSLLASLLSAGAAYSIIPHLNIASDVEGLRELPAVAFELDIPQIMPVMSALVLSVLLGLSTIWTKWGTLMHALQELQEMVLQIVKRVVIPILPFYIMVTFCSLAWEGTITRQLPIFLEVILIVLVGHFLWLAVLYGFASLYSRRSGLEVLRHYGPAYLTAVGTMSSAATLTAAERR